MTTACPNLRQQLSAIKDKAREFSEALASGIQAGDLARPQALKAELEQMMAELRAELCPRELKAAWGNPQTREKSDIILNIKEIIADSKAFYEKYFPDIEFNEPEIKRIIAKNKKEMEKEMEAYGYDLILAIPAGLPGPEELNRVLIESMVEPKKGAVEKTYKSTNFNAGGGFPVAKNTHPSKTRVILTKNIQNVYQSGDPILKATLDKSLCELVLNIPASEWQKIKSDESQKQKKIEETLEKLRQGGGIDYTAVIKDKNVQPKEISIQAEGLSLEEYIIFQRQYFDQNQKHLDESGWAWLLKTLSGSRVADAGWYPGSRRLDASVGGPDNASDSLGARPSRSFSI